MNRIKIFLSLLFLIATLSLTNAQISIFTVAYSTSAPLGITKDYIEDYSWRGFALEERYFVERDMSIGFYLGWNVFSKKLVDHEENFGDGEGVLYGTQYRYINSFPILANMHYHFLRDKVVRPYVGAGAGPYIVNQRTEMGLYSSTQKRWQFGLQPEVGLWIDLAAGTNLMFGAKYNYAFKTKKGDALSYLNINAGISFVY